MDFGSTEWAKPFAFSLSLFKNPVYVHVRIAHAQLQNVKYLLLLNIGDSDRQTPILHFQVFTEIWHWTWLLKPGKYLSHESNRRGNF